VSSPELQYGLPEDLSAIKYIYFDSDLGQIEKDFKDPEDGFWEKNNSEGIKRNSEVY